MTTTKQVGRNCLADFFGCDPHGAAEMAEILASVGSFASFCEEPGEGGPGNGRSNYRSIASYLPYVAMKIRQEGWLSKGKAYERDGHTNAATAVQAEAQMSANDAKHRNGERVPEKDEPTAADYALATKTIEGCAAHFDSVAPETLTDYEHNLRVAMMSSVCEPKTFGIVASAINFLARVEEKKQERVDFTKSEHVGTIGKRQIFRNLKCVYPGFGGRPVVFVDDLGNKITAWNPGWQVEKGASYNVKATPVKQEEYKGIKSTMVNRPVLATEKDLAPKAPKKARGRKNPETGDCMTCEATDGPGTGNPYPCALHPETK